MFRNKIVLLQFLSFKKPQNNQYRKIDLKGFCLKFFFRSRAFRKYFKRLIFRHPRFISLLPLVGSERYRSGTCNMGTILPLICKYSF